MALGQLLHSVPVLKAGLCSSNKGLLLGEVEVKASFETTKYSRKERNLWEVLVKPSAIRVTQGPGATPGGHLSVDAYSSISESRGSWGSWFRLLMCLLRACLAPFLIFCTLKTGIWEHIMDGSD